MLIYYITTGLIIYFISRFLNHLKFNEKPLNKYVAIIISTTIFIALTVIYFIIRLNVHHQLQISSGIEFEQKKFFSIGQSILGALIFYFTIKKIVKQKVQSVETEKIEPKL